MLRCTDVRVEQNRRLLRPFAGWLNHGHHLLSFPRSVLAHFIHALSYHPIANMKLLSAAVALIAAGSAAAFAPAPLVTTSRNAVATRMAAAEEFYIDEERRFIMNLIMVGAGGVTVLGFGVPFILFFFPPGAGGGEGGIPAKDALGNDILAKDYLAAKPAGDRSLAQGLKGDAT